MNKPLLAAALTTLAGCYDLPDFPRYQADIEQDARGKICQQSKGPTSHAPDYYVIEGAENVLDLVQATASGKKKMAFLKVKFHTG